MRSSGLSADQHTALSAFIHAAGGLLRAELAQGAEVPFELAAHRGRAGAQTTLYCYEPLTDAFIAERELELASLPEHAAAAGILQDMHGLERYLASRGVGDVQGIVARDMRARMGPGVRARGQAQVKTALRELLADVFEGRTDFELSPERATAAIERLQRAELAGESDTVTVLATLYGLTIASEEIALTKGLTIASADVPGDVPQVARLGDDGRGQHLLVSLALEPGEAVGEDPAGDPERLVEGGEATVIAAGRELMKDLLRALRLFGDGRVVLGELAWVRSGGDDGRWRTIALGSGGRPHGMLVVAAEQEDELRAFCNLVSRRSPSANELAWALRRFELGCERASAYEGLSDHLLALRALLEPEGPSSGLLAGRLAALCATPEQRVRLTGRVTKALALERAVIAGTLKERSATLTLAREMSDHLRALLRDMICGHLKFDLVSLADELLMEHEPALDDESSGEQPVGDPGEAGEILNVLV